MANWAFIRKRERQFDSRHLYSDTVEVVVETIQAASSNDLFKTPTLIGSGVFTVPGVFEFRQFDSMKFMAGGTLLNGDAYFLTDVSWESTLKKQGSVIVHDDDEYIITALEKSTVADSIIAVLRRKE